MFSNPSFGTIRTAGSADNPLLCLNDLCQILDLDSRVVVRRLTKGVHVIGAPLPTAKGIQQANFVTQSGLFKTIFQSRKPEAEAFTNWVCSEVLPAIGKTGSYVVPRPKPQSQSLPFSYANITERLKHLEERIKALEERPALPKPKATQVSYSLEEMAKELDTHYLTLRDLLVSIKLMHRHQHCWEPTAYGVGCFTNLPIPRFEADRIRLTEQGRKEVIESYPTYKKQNRLLKLITK